MFEYLSFPLTILRNQTATANIDERKKKIQKNWQQKKDCEIHFPDMCVLQKKKRCMVKDRQGVVRSGVVWTREKKAMDLSDRHAWVLAFFFPSIFNT